MGSGGGAEEERIDTLNWRSGRDFQRLRLQQRKTLQHMIAVSRAYALSGDKTKAKSVHQDFLTIWKDADPNIPMLKQAKTEYAKLQ